MAEKFEKTEKKVTIRLPLTPHEKDDVYVSVNNYDCIIKRGVEVEVPESVVEVLRHKEDMVMASINFIEAAQSK